MMMIVMVPAMPASPPAPEPGTCKVALHLDRVSLSDIWECWARTFCCGERKRTVDEGGPPAPPAKVFHVEHFVGVLLYV